MAKVKELKEEQNKEKPVLHGILEEFRTDIELEIKNTNNNKILLECGRVMPQIDSNFRYQFNIEYIPNIPNDSPCKLTIGKEEYDVWVVAVDGTHIIISSEKELPPALGKVYLESGTTILLECLIKCIEENAETMNPTADRLIPKREDSGIIYNTYEKISEFSAPENYKGFNEPQIKAVESALTNNITYIWGPPGTGKTQVIGAIVEELMQKERSVLLLSHTNTAVDSAIKRICENIGDKSTGTWPILRLGIPSGNPEIPKQCLMESHVAEQGKEFQELLDDEKEKLTHIEEKIVEIEKNIVRCIWIENSNINDIAYEINQIEEIQKRRSELQHQLDASMNRLSELRNDPEFAEYYAYVEKRGLCEKRKSSLDDRINELTSDKKNKDSLVRESIEELVKHKKCEDLLSELQKYPSKQSIQKTISECGYEAFRLRKRNDSIGTQIESCRKIIAEYEKKGAIRKFLASNLDEVDEAERVLPNLHEEYKRNNEAIGRLEREAEERNRELSIIQAIELQIDSLGLTHTKQFWEEKLSMLEENLNEIKVQTESIQAELFSLIDELGQIEQFISGNKEKTFILTEAEAHHDNICKCLGEVSNDEVRALARVNELINKERKLSSMLFVINSEKPRECYETLVVEYERCNELVAGQSEEKLIAEKDEFAKARVEVKKQITTLEEKLNSLEREVILSRSVVGTTLTKAYTNAVLKERKFDTVIVDEVSMALIPVLWCACLLAEHNIVVVGDFLQLSPISQIDYRDYEDTMDVKERWLKEDVFRRNMIDKQLETVNAKSKADNIVMLNHQYRMEKEIADIANELYYCEYGGLKSNDNTPKRNEVRQKFINWYGHENTVDKHIYMVDTENLHAWVNSIPTATGHTRINCFSASLDVTLAFNHIDPVIKRIFEGENVKNEILVLIIVPYKAQVEKLKQIIRIEYTRRGLNPEVYNFIKAGTIHSFQGQEADIVIFDFVVDEPHIRSNLFMPDEFNGDDLKRMFNVAITRARFKLYFIGNFNFLKKRAQGTQLKLLLSILDKYPRIDAAKNFPRLRATVPPNIESKRIDFEKILITTGTEAVPLIKDDIAAANNCIVIYSAFLTENRIGDFLPYLSDAVKRGVKIIVITKPLDERKKGELQQYKKCEDGLKNHGIHVVHKMGMHEKVIAIDNRIIWNGSLNILSFTGNTAETMTRYDDIEYTENQLQVIGFDEIAESCVNIQRKTCPVCGKEMRFGESSRGGYYWACEDKCFTYSFGDPYPTDGVLRCKKPDCCGEYKFVMKNEPRWVCVENGKHYQKFRYSDLRLPKMKDKLTAEELDRVEKLHEEIEERKKRSSK